MRRRSMLGFMAMALCATLGFGVTGARAADTAKPAKPKAAKAAKKGIKGKIESVNAAGKSFVVTNKKTAATTTVTTDASTKFVKQDESAGAFTDLKVGDKVQVGGAAPVDNKMTASTVHIGGKKKKEKPAK